MHVARQRPRCGTDISMGMYSRRQEKVFQSVHIQGVQSEGDKLAPRMRSLKLVQ